jgi:hypothetical protein
LKALFDDENTVNFSHKSFLESILGKRETFSRRSKKIRGEFSWKILFELLQVEIFFYFNEGFS